MALLDSHHHNLKKQEDPDNIDYWNLITDLNIGLCKLLIDSEKSADEKWNAIDRMFNEIWKKAGSEAKKVAELEHLQFLIHSLNQAAGNTHGFSPIGTTASKDKLGIYIEELRVALNAVKAKS